MVGRLGNRFADVRQIAVLRGGGLGDLLFALPAVEALAAAYPEAEITLLGTPMHVALFEGRPSPFARIEVLPPRPGVRDGPEDSAASAAFRNRMRERAYDLAVQVHGGGRNSNPFLLELAARHTVGLATEDAAPLERMLPYLLYQHEVLRALEVVALAGAAPVQLEPRLRLTEHECVRRQRADHATPRTVVIHPGATDPRRRWPAAAFGEVAAELAADGAKVLVVGDETDKEAADEIVEVAGSPAVRNVAGQRSLAELVGLLVDCSLVVANDSGPRHLGLAVGAPTVGIYWFGNVINASPLSRGRHRIQMSWTTHCPVCGRDVTQVGWTAVRCEHDDSFVADIPVAAVLADARQLLRR